MPSNPVDSIRSIAFVGHGGAGKTTLAEALLHAAGAIPAKGSVERGTTVCDWDPQEKEAGHSLASAVVHLRYKDVLVDIVDTPGYPDFAGQAVAALAGVDTALVVVNAQTGIELTAERMMKAAAARGLCRMVVVNKIDAPNVDLPALVAELRERFGKECLLLDLPAHDAKDVVEVLGQADGDSDFDSVAAAHRALVDQVIEEDEDLLARFLEEGADPTPAELHAPFERALRAGHLVPVLFVSAKTGAGIPELLHVLQTLAPSPAEGNPPPLYRPDGSSFIAVADSARHVVAHVFKVVVDPYMGKVSVFRVHQGTVRRDMPLYVGDGKKPFKAAHLYKLQGKDFIEVQELMPGEIGAVAKVDEVGFDALLHDNHDEDQLAFAPLDFPRPMQGLAVETKKQGDEQRLFEVLHKLELEDPCFRVERHPTTHETVIFGLGEMHLRSKLEKMAGKFKLELATRPPTVPYRETITGSAEGHCRHKKQTGGAGQFGEVYLRVEARERGAGFEFVDAVRGGAIPGVFMPAIEKGVRQALTDGVIAGYPLEDVRVTVYDGKTHPVDGKEIAFVTAGRKATIEAVLAAGPIVLEPIVAIEITAPEAYLGDLAADLSTRRGHVTGTVQGHNGVMVVQGEVPLAEVTDYASRLKSMTGGEGAYSIDFARHAPVPPATQQKLTAGHKRVEIED